MTDKKKKIGLTESSIMRNIKNPKIKTITTAPPKNNFMQIVEQTHEEKIAMYMKCTKKELIEMLIECNRLLHIKVYD